MLDLLDLRSPSIEEKKDYLAWLNEIDEIGKAYSWNKELMPSEIQSRFTYLMHLQDDFEQAYN